MSGISTSLRIWFLVHFVLDIAFAIPLLFFTGQFLTALGFQTGDPLPARLVGAALVGIGGASLAMHKKGVEAYRAMLTLKLLWSGSAILALAVALPQNQSAAVWLLLTVFALFFFIWAYYFRRLR